MKILYYFDLGESTVFQIKEVGFNKCLKRNYIHEKWRTIILTYE